MEYTHQTKQKKNETKLKNYKKKNEVSSSNILAFSFPFTAHYKLYPTKYQS